MIPAVLLALAIGLDQPVVLEGSVPLAAGKPPVRVQVVFLSGGITNGGCSGGSIYTGRFAVVVTPSDGVPVESDLNALLRTDEVSFPVPSNSHPWPIHFADLNGDGKPDFGIAPHFCGNNGRYSLFTIYPHGRVGRIPVIPEDPLVFDDAPSSSSLRAVPGGFEAALYDNSTGSGTTRTYRWDDSHWAFALVRPNGDPHVIVSTINNSVSARPPLFAVDSGLIEPLPESPTHPITFVGGRTGSDTTAAFTLPSGAQVRIVEAPFEASLFKVVGCSTGEARCLINGQVPFGSGNGLPRTYVKSITVSCKGRSYLLDSSQMFNAWGSRPLAYPLPSAVRYFGGNCFDSANCQFRGVFSDAGGSFVAEWVIVGGAVVRTILTDRNDVVGFIMNNIDPPEFE